MDDHTAAAMALYRAPAQWTAARLTPETRGGWYYRPSAFCRLSVQWGGEAERQHVPLLNEGCLNVYWCLKIPKTRLSDSTGQASGDS